MVPRVPRIGSKGLRRENDPPLLVLISLASGPKHGHALMGDIEQFAGVRLGPGTLYGAITNLQDQGLIEPLEPDGRRRPYRITASGVASLTQVLDAMDRVLKAGRKSLRPLASPSNLGTLRI